MNWGIADFQCGMTMLTPDYADYADYASSVQKGIIIRELGITFLTNRYEGNTAGSKWRISSLATKKWGVSHFDLGFKSK